MVLAGYVVEFAFGGLGLVPTTRHAKVTEMAIHWDYTAALNIVALAVAAGLVFRFVQSGALPDAQDDGRGATRRRPRTRPPQPP